MNISAAEVKALRDRTGAGMMECKKALVESGGDVDKAVDMMRKAGLAKADKKAGRTAAEGRIAMAGDGRCAAIVEVNCETDFVAGGEVFAEFANAVAARVLAAAPDDVAQLGLQPLSTGGSVDEARRELVVKLGENVAIRRFARIATEHGSIGRYLHGARIGVLVELAGGSPELAKDIAMHVAASRPLCVSPEQVPPEILERERDVQSAQAQASGKPAEIVEKMIDGRLRKFVNEVALTGQPFVKDPERSVGQVLKAGGAEVLRFVRFEVGEGIEREEADFAAEVLAQVRGR